MTSRRDFIKGSSIVLAGSLFKAEQFQFLAKPSSVIVIGAGFSGLAAAAQLKKKKLKVTVLEARNRIGGRVFSFNIPDENLVIELGAEWVGKSHERIIEMCDEFNLELFNNQFDSHLVYKGKYYGKDEWRYSENWKGKWEGLIKQYQGMKKHEKDALNQQLDKYDWWHYLVNNGCDGMDLDLRELLDSTDFGESIRHVSAFAALAEYAESSEKNEMDYKIRGGNGQLAKKLAERVGVENILLEHGVTKVEQTALGVKVTCSNGKVFRDDKLICTVPTFSLKKIQWLPGLPKEKIDAINQLQYARINKHPVLFSDRFWPEDMDMVTDLPAHYFYHATKNQASKKGVLISYTIGDKAAVTANQDDAYHKAMISQALLPGFGDIQSKMEKQWNYYWGNDEFSKGAYALYGPGQWFTLRPTLAKTFMHTHFAGEHLADWQGFMEGAINTGEDAAKAIAG
ncbi:MAG: FAD-dependent oxidoreductase [Chitinophagaceae bacterium]|nr:MAG: FAD-dependent oxidoreductase [Chitinophagaceae bacterium]